MPKEGNYPPLSPKELVKIYEKHFWFLSLPRQLLPLDAVLLGISETKKKKKAGDLFFNPSWRGPWKLSSQDESFRQRPPEVEPRIPGQEELVQRPGLGPPHPCLYLPYLGLLTSASHPLGVLSWGL